MTTTTRSGPRTAAPALSRAVPLAAAGAAAAVAVVHLLFDALGADFVVAPPGQAETTVGVAQAAGVGLAVTLVGGLVAAALAARTRRPARLFSVLVLVALVVMAPNPVLAADQALTVVALELEHLVAAAVALGVLLPALRGRERA